MVRSDDEHEQVHTRYTETLKVVTHIFLFSSAWRPFNRRSVKGRDRAEKFLNARKEEMRIEAIFGDNFLFS